MNKLAIFVEGTTEQIFAEKLVQYLGKRQRLGIRVERMHGGRRSVGRAISEIQGTSETGDHEYFVLIVDCGQDERVTSDIRERYDALIASDYRIIVGIRDVHPHARDDISRLRRAVASVLPSRPIQPLLVLGIMEAETWFLAEYTHFPRIHAALTLDRIERECGFNPQRDDMQLRDQPSKDLENIYFLEAINYHKTRNQVDRTVNSLDFDAIQDVVSAKIPDLFALIDIVQRFFAVT